MIVASSRPLNPVTSWDLTTSSLRVRSPEFGMPLEMESDNKKVLSVQLNAAVRGAFLYDASAPCIYDPTNRSRENCRQGEWQGSSLDSPRTRKTSPEKRTGECFTRLGHTASLPIIKCDPYPYQMHSLSESKASEKVNPSESNDSFYSGKESSKTASSFHHQNLSGITSRDYRVMANWQDGWLEPDQKEISHNRASTVPTAEYISKPCISIDGISKDIPVDRVFGQRTDIKILHDRALSSNGNFPHNATLIDDNNMSTHNSPLSDPRCRPNTPSLSNFTKSSHQIIKPNEDHESRRRLLKELFSAKYDSLRTSNSLEDQAIPDVARITDDSSRMILGQHKSWLQMEERLLNRIYDLQKERCLLQSRVEELTSQNLVLSEKVKVVADQLEKREQEIEGERRQLREKILDMVNFGKTKNQNRDVQTNLIKFRGASNDVCNCFQEPTAISHHNDDDDDDDNIRRGLQEKLASCQIQFALERKQWINDKYKVLRYQKLLQRKYEEVVAENQLLKSKIEGDSLLN